MEGCGRWIGEHWKMLQTTWCGDRSEKRLISGSIARMAAVAACAIDVGGTFVRMTNVR